ncbi:MAG: hypothetical protein A3C10_03390 [Candidatus Magasanikbacteria bacterium RIFCSPHIGHO2_02_FULL_48_18]|nr:MAG: hypothetical protein A3I74_03110 [Candidatus Magasanikbacteria bacterium RIFCSPLOWO2_02_FULL_47_16]OGH80201.1 MAG: hypothetical protein A3C10_03390 [Candidatus Magasanikbacteria bacterium RIFCSPHIGHO2_02_FULL_48_18]
MKIIFLLPHLKISGGVKILLMYADRLSRKGHHVSVLVGNPHAWRRQVINFFKIKPSWFSTIQASIVRVKNFEEEYIPDADILVTSVWYSAVQALQYKRHSAKKFLFIQHDEKLYHAERSGVEKAYCSSLEKIVVSSWLQDVVRDEYHGDAFLLLNPIDREFFSPCRTRNEDGGIRIVMMHHSYAWKGTAEGISVVEALKKKYPTIRLILFGAREKTISVPHDEYYYNPPQKKIPELYSNADIYLCPSWDEGAGLPSMEAMACRTALVTYDNGGSRDFAFDGKTAFVAKHRDIADLKKKLDVCIRDSVLRKQIAESGYQYIRRMPSWEEQTQRLEQFFLSALSL